MTVSGLDFRQTWLWRQAFLNPRSDSTTDEQEFFRTQYLSIRERAAHLVSRIAVDLPGMTVHDVSHLDALWDTASSVAEGAVNVNPAEAFVLGASILLHDAAMSLAAYPGGLAEVRATVAWKDAVARLALASEEGGGEKFDVENPPNDILQRIVPDVLRRLHAERAEELAEQAWIAADGSQVYLVEDSELRRFYGPTIGQIAHSHWWSVQKLEQEFSEDLGALAHRTLNRVDRVKLACLLRVADALHLDSRRAPRFLRAITNPSGISALHWAFQERLARPHIELDAVVFTTGQPFGREDAEAWWLAYDTLNSVDRELRDVDLLLQGRGREVLKARRVKGAGSPEMLARTVQTRGWRPVDARLQVSDVPRIVENLGGSKLYGNDPTVALRELIQNAADAVQARRKFQKRPADWGLITVGLLSDADKVWLVVEDTGIGMSEQVMTGPLLDFGTSFWRSPQAMEEFPGLMAAGMQAIGRFGIGFFSVFMLGPVVRVYSRRCDKGQETGRLLEFRGGTSARPILSPAPKEPVPIDGGTRVEVLLKIHPYQPGGLLHINSYTKRTMSLATLVGAVAPNLDVAIATLVKEGAEPVARPGDWLEISDFDLVRRLNPTADHSEADTPKADRALMQPIEGDNDQVYGRAFISPSRYSYSPDGGWVTISGLRAGRLHNVEGILLGEAMTAARDAAQPIATKEALAYWASKQAELITAFVKDEERQARSAEVVLECGGELGGLKFLKWGTDWLSTSEFEERLRSSSEIAISFNGEFDYDEDQDEVHPKEFREGFKGSDDVAVVLKHDGGILRAGNNNWPKSITAQPKWSDSNIAEYTRNLIRHAWGDDLQEDDEDRVVGKVHFTDIIRGVTVFRASPQTDDPFP
ncbi:ATP-binding protein [Rhizobium sophorae]|uniref:ATP-binding protein n=1 Tax=Rhizobium sophorae TaxID=1535242 RepID=A0A7Y3WD92_9HYPH|nr:ATP-binding protein [Rhizobium sophorae]NNU35953.1 ATP-binding protein [Rhizobium sophorae]